MRIGARVSAKIDRRMTKTSVLSKYERNFLTGTAFPSLPVNLGPRDVSQLKCHKTLKVKCRSNISMINYSVLTI